MFTSSLKKIHLFSIFTFLCLTLVVNTAQADCTSPTKAEGVILYNDDENTLQVCAGSTWEALHKGDTGSGGCVTPTRGEGAVIYNADSNIPQVCSGSTWIALGVIDTGAASGGCSSPTGLEGVIIYNDDADLAQYCDGSTWQKIAGPRSTPECPIIGDICNDGSVYAGESPAGGRMYTTRCDAGTVYTTSCTGTKLQNQWRSSNSTDTSIPNCSIASSCRKDGRTNTNTLVALGVTYGVANYCNELDIHGKTDWYAPSAPELYVLYLNKSAIGGFSSTNYYWSSSENNSEKGVRMYFSSGATHSGKKSNTDSGNEYTRCVRR